MKKYIPRQQRDPNFMILADQAFNSKGKAPSFLPHRQELPANFIIFPAPAYLACTNSIIETAKKAVAM